MPYLKGCHPTLECDKLSLLQIQTERSLYLHVNLSVAKQNKKNRIMQKSLKSHVFIYWAHSI